VTVGLQQLPAMSHMILPASFLSSLIHDDDLDHYSPATASPATPHLQVSTALDLPAIRCSPKTLHNIN
jgi:hypothetical protein